MNNHDLDWLAAQRPSRSGADPEAHDRALLSLLRHAAARPAGRRGRRDFAGRLNSRMLAVATGTGMAAIAAAVVLSATGGTQLPAAAGHGSTHALQAGVAHHGAKSALVRLADNLGTTTAAAGDATLIQRTTHTGGQDVSVYDLYGDNGTYYFSRDESGLPSQVSGDHNLADGLFGREVAAAKAAATGNVAQAAIELANAPDPNRSPLITPTNDGATGSPQAEAEAIQAKEKATGTPQGVGSLFDNWAWEDSQDAMIAGAGDPQVRAGVLRILATLPDVTVTQGTSGGQPTLVMSAGADEVGAGYSEQLTVNAETGMPIEFVGGQTGGPAATTVDYQVQRVTLSELAAGTGLPSFSGNQ